MNPVVLETAAREFAAATANPPFLFDLGPQKGRTVVDEVQSSPVAKPDAAIEDRTIPGGPDGSVSVRIVRPPNARETLPVVMYTHGAGWVFGNAHTHDRLIREIAVRADAAVVFPNYSLSPEARYPVALEECYAVLKWIAEQGGEQKFDASRLVVAGDSVGGNLTAAVTLVAKERGGPRITGQLLYYPVTDAAFDTDSYHQFATDHFLRRDAMMWFWDQYLPDRAQRSRITASPLRATTEQLRGLPPALVITAEADVLRDEGEAYANKLRAAGVPTSAVRFQGIIHDFVMLNALAEADATRAAMTLSTAWIRKRFGESA